MPYTNTPTSPSPTLTRSLARTLTCSITQLLAGERPQGIGNTNEFQLADLLRAWALLEDHIVDAAFGNPAPLLEVLPELFPGHIVAIRAGLTKGKLWKLTAGQTVRYALGDWDTNFQVALPLLLKPGGVYYDVGCNYGFDSLLGATVVGDAGAVYAFDALRSMCDATRDIFDINGFTGGRVCEAALSNRMGTATFYRHKRSTGLGSLVPIQDPGDVESVHVPTTTLDAFAAAEREPDVVKIDVEGAEAMVLEGATRLLASASPPVFLIELHSPEAARGVTATLEAHGYAWFSWFGVAPSALSTRLVNHILAVRRDDGRMAHVERAMQPPPAYSATTRMT